MQEHIDDMDCSVGNPILAKGYANELDKWKNANREVSDAYLRIRAKLNAYDTPYGPTFEQIYTHTEAKLDELLERAEQAEKTCAEMRDVIAKCGIVFDAVRAKGGTKIEAFRLADDAITQCVSNAVSPHGMGSTYISLTDPVIVGLVDSLKLHTKMIPDIVADGVLLAYEARKKEAGL